MIEECDRSSAVLKVDFSENVSVNQNEIQSAHWYHQQVVIFTGHICVNQNVKDSFAIVSDNLDHTKEAVYTYMLELFDTINNLSNLSSQFKQHFLFSNVHGLGNEFNFQIVWNFFATSHWKGAVDMGCNIKPLDRRYVRTTTAAPNNAVAYYKLARGLNMRITIHSVHWGINSPQKHPPPLSCQAPLKSANCPSPPF